ncbi:CBS domain-containing protein [Methanolobus sp. ZRKC2]|uniref:CBS domain-containing protein n=1 Tax=Methanolobus sp. ZRKC2 TaxID=3125783 RepID=UPI0032488C97
MSKDPVSVREDDYMTHARQVMRDNLMRGLPVLDEEQRVVGILTDQDILEIKSNKSNVTVRGYAREYPVITPDTDIMVAAKMLLEAKQHRAPVISSSADRDLMGMVSEADILRHIQPTKKSPKAVKDIMTKSVETAYPDESIAKLWSNMLEWDYTGIPVVSHKKQTMGIVTRSDIIRSGYARIGSSDMHGSGSGDAPKVEKVMSTPLYSISPEASVSEAIHTVLKHNIGRISVTSDNKLVGIADRYDLLKACLTGTGIR